MAEIVNRLPYAISERLATLSGQVTQLEGRAIDYAIAGIPFLSAASRDFPFIIETAQMQRDQFDNEQEPGEQTLQGWWLRSQDSWHGGAGAKFQESRTSTDPSIRFFESSGVDVWTEGEATLLRRLVQATPAATEANCLHVVGDTIYYGTGPEVRKTVIGSAATTTLHTAPGETIVDIVAGRDAWYAVSQEGFVYTGAVTGVGAVKRFPLTNADASPAGTPQIIWAKHRLFATWGRRVYVVDTTLATGTAMADIYSHPTLDWVYTGLADAPAAVFASGWSYAESAIHAITVENTGDIPTLGGGLTVAILPPGERLDRIAVLAGTLVALGTSKGLRIGIIDSETIQYGPLFLEPEGVVACTGLTAWGRFFYAAFQTDDSRAVVYRVDGSREVENGEFAFAADVETTTVGYFGDIGIGPDDRVVCAFFNGTYPTQAVAKYQYQHTDELCAEGWIQFGQIRYRTVEPKIFKWFSMDAEPLLGTFIVDAVTEGGSLARIIEYNTPGVGDLPQAAIPTNLGPQRSMGLQITMQRSGSDATEGPILHSYSIKSLPAVKPQRLIRLPLSCFDRETWYTGQEDGYDGFARERLTALQSAEDTGDLVLWQDFSSPDDATGNLVKIDKITFQQSAPPNPVVGNRGYGGVMLLELRTVD